MLKTLGSNVISMRLQRIGFQATKVVNLPLKIKTDLEKLASPHPP